MIGRLRMSKPQLPNLVIAQRVIDKMKAAADRFLADETGEAMVGLVAASAHATTIYVLDTIAPTDANTVREWATFQQGDELQQEIFWWMVENWRVYREMRRDSQGKPLLAKWDLPLRHIGDWHKQPGFMIQPSQGDLMTARRMLEDQESELEFLLAPIVTLGHPSDGELPSYDNFLTVPQGDDTVMRVDFWFLDRHSRDFMPISPAIYPDVQLPGLPEPPWHLSDETRFTYEYQLLQENLSFVSAPVLWNVDVYPPLQVCFLCKREGTGKVLIVNTPWNYPAGAPSLHIAPDGDLNLEGDIYEVFEDLWEDSKPVADPSGWSWSDGRHLIDYVFAVEESLGLKPASKE